MHYFEASFMIPLLIKYSYFEVLGVRSVDQVYQGFSEHKIETVLVSNWVVMENFEKCLIEPKFSLMYLGMLLRPAELQRASQLREH